MLRRAGDSNWGAGRIVAVARQTLRAALRLRVAWLFGAGVGILLLLPLGLREFRLGAMELKFLTDFGFGAIALGASLLAVLATTHLYFDDLESGTMASVLTRSVRRAEYLGGKLAGLGVMLAAGIVLLAITLGAVLAIRAEQLGTIAIAPGVFGQAALLIWFKTTLIASMTLVVCCYAQSALFASCVGLMLAAIAHLRPFASADSWLDWIRFWPDLTRFDIEVLLGNGRSLGWRTGALLAGYWFLFLMGLGGVATYVFRRREF